MSLVAYGSSDESSDEEVISEESDKQLSKVTEIKQIPTSAESKQILTTELKHTSIAELKQITTTSEIKQIPKNTGIQKIFKNAEIGEIVKSEEIAENMTEKQTSNNVKETCNFSRSRIDLPIPKTVQEPKNLNENESPKADLYNSGTINFNLLPQPKSKEIVESIIEDEDDYVPPPKIVHEQIEKPNKKEKGPVKISVPSLSDFKDLEKESETKMRIKPSQKGSGLFAVLPPPRSETLLKSKTMVPYSLAKKAENPRTVSKPLKTEEVRRVKISPNDKKSKKSIANYDSNSDDEDNSHKIDFFSLSKSDDIPIPEIPILDIVNETLKHSRESMKPDNYQEIPTNENQQTEVPIPDKTLISNVINLPKEEIIQKNKAEVGPKLPVPEQDYNVDSTGNLVFDEKAIEYLCGKRGVKRKNKEFEGVDIIEISGEDIKPDEREWMVKALTEEPVTRPISQGAGPSGLSKKKHQITYLAHQAKAMEVELKNQWAQNKLTRQQTQSKYGF